MLASRDLAPSVKNFPSVFLYEDALKLYQELRIDPVNLHIRVVTTLKLLL